MAQQLPDTNFPRLSYIKINDSTMAFVVNSDHRDLGHGFTFYTHKCVQDGKIYHFETFKTNLGCCPNCNQGGILVAAETYHAGPIHTKEDDKIDEAEGLRIQKMRDFIGTPAPAVIEYASKEASRFK